MCCQGGVYYCSSCPNATFETVSARWMRMESRLMLKCRFWVDNLISKYGVHFY